MTATGLSWLQIINRVLARLREASVAANNTTTYSSMIGALVNQVKTEIEEAYYWSSMRDTYSVSATVGNTNYSLTGGGAAVVIIDGWNITTAQQLEKGTNADFNSKFFGVTTLQTGDVSQFLPAGLDANYDRTVDIWPSPASTQSLKFNVYKPQADLALDADVPLCPQNVLIEETIARALVERGDQGAAQPQPGQTFIRADLLAAAVSRESGQDDDEMRWEPE